MLKEASVSRKRGQLQMTHSSGCVTSDVKSPVAASSLDEDESICMAAATWGKGMSSMVPVSLPAAVWTLGVSPLAATSLPMLGPA